MNVASKWLNFDEKKGDFKCTRNTFTAMFTYARVVSVGLEIASVELVLKR